MVTWPSVQRTMRTRSEWSPPWPPTSCGMNSVTSHRPVGVRQVVRSTKLSPRYSRRSTVPSAGAISHRPFSASPSSAAKTASESSRGRQSQSMLPVRETSAAVARSASRA